MQTKRDTGCLLQAQLEAEREDDLKLVKKVANLYSRQEPALSLKALKTLKKVYTSEVFLKMLTFNPKDTLIMGLINLVLGIERRFKVSEEAKVPKELLVQNYPQMQLAQSTLSLNHGQNPSQAHQVDGDVSMLFFQFTVTKARKMRSEIFSILKSVVKSQAHPAYATCLIRSNQFLEWAFLCGEYKEYIDAFCRHLTLTEQI